MCAPYLTLWLNPPTWAPAFAVVILAVSELAERAARRQSSSEGKNPLGMRESPEVDELYGRQRPPQESLRHGAETVGQIRTESAMARRARTCSQKTSRLEERCHRLDRGLGAVDQRHLRAHHFRDDAREQRIVCAAEQDGVGGAAQVREVSLRDQPRNLTVDPSLFRERNEERTGTRHHARQRSEP